MASVLFISNFNYLLVIFLAQRRYMYSSTHSIVSIITCMSAMCTVRHSKVGDFLESLEHKFLGSTYFMQYLFTFTAISRHCLTCTGELIKHSYYRISGYFQGTKFSWFSHFLCLSRKIILQKCCHATPFYMSMWVIRENIFCESSILGKTQKFSTLKKKTIYSIIVH